MRQEPLFPRFNARGWVLVVMKRQSPTLELYQSIQRSREYYGFVLYLVSWIFFFIYIIWTTFSEEMLTSLGIYYYPNQYFYILINSKWALIFPIWTCGFLIFILLFYIGHNLFSILPLDAVATFTDDDACILTDTTLITFHNSDQEYIPPLQDLPLHYVSTLFKLPNFCIKEE
jgi:phosphatidylinositol glycan class P protein